MNLAAQFSIKGNILKFAPNRGWRTYSGCKVLDEIEGREQPEDSYYREEWIDSVVTANNPDERDVGEGLSKDRLMLPSLESSPKDPVRLRLEKEALQLKQWDRFFCPAGEEFIEYTSKKGLTVVECYGGKTEF